MASHLAFPMHQTPVIHPVATPTNTNLGPANFCSPIISNPPATKRKGSKAIADAPHAAKRSRGKASASKIPNKGMYVVQSCAALHLIYVSE